MWERCRTKHLFCIFKTSIELEGFFQAGMFLYSALICAVSCPVLIAVRCLIVLLFKTWAVLFFWCVCLTSSECFSVNFCTLVWSSVFLNCGVCHPHPSKATALMFGYARFSKQPHGLLYLEGKMRICSFFFALLTTWVKLRNLKYLYNNQSGDFKSSYSAEIANQWCPQQCFASVCMYGGSSQFLSVPWVQYSMTAFLFLCWTSLSSFGSSFCQHF